MNYKKVFIILIMFLMIIGCKQNNIKTNEESNNSEVIDTVKVTINNKEYIINLENNETAKSFVSLLPLRLDMSELNGNEKYVYLYKSLPTNEYSPKKINAGDVMLYNDNCIVIFYKSFNTPYKYTKIGHIDNLPDLGNSNIVVDIEK